MNFATRPGRAFRANGLIRAGLALAAVAATSLPAGAQTPQPLQDQVAQADAALFRAIFDDCNPDAPRTGSSWPGRPRPRSRSPPQPRSPAAAP